MRILAESLFRLNPSWYAIILRDMSIWLACVGEIYGWTEKITTHVESLSKKADCYDIQLFFLSFLVLVESKSSYKEKKESTSSIQLKALYNPFFFGLSKNWPVLPKKSQ